MDRLNFPKFVVLGFLYINLGRPQDVLPFLRLIHPGIIFGIFTILCLIFFKNEIKLLQGFKYQEIKWFSLLLGLMIFDTLFSIYKRRSVDFLQEYFILVIFFLGLILFLNSEKDFRRLAGVILFSSLTISVPILLRGPIRERVSVGTYYDPNDLAMLLTTSLPFVIFFFHSKKSLTIVFAILTCISAITAIIATQSRMGFLALVFLGLQYFFRAISAKKQFMTKLIIGLSFLLLFSALANPDYWNRINSIFRKGDTGSGRTVVWKRSFKMLPEYAIIGSGPGTFSSAYGRMLKAGKFKTVGVPHYDLGWKSAHNSYILVMIELGLPGLFIFLGLIYVILFGLRRIRKLFKLVKPDADALIMANIIEISFLTFLFCAIFLSLAYSPVFVTLMSAGLLVRKIAYHELADFEAIPQTDLPHPDDNSYSR